MIDFDTKKMDLPFTKFLKFYKNAEKSLQPNIEAACLSTISTKHKPHSRFINIKYINKNEFIFFSNYNSNKAEDIDFNNNIALNFFWNTTQTQIRVEGKIFQLSGEKSDNHWKNRSKYKNALAISSMQSSLTYSYEKVVSKYETTLKEMDLSIRPSYWGGYSIHPIYFEFWKGNKSRINKRTVFKKIGDEWEEYVLQP